LEVTSSTDSGQTERLLDRIDHGDESALSRLLECHRSYVKRVVELRMDDELLARVDPSDVVQETQLMAANRIDGFLKHRGTSFRIWLRAETLARLVDVRRRHRAQKRSVRREIRLSDASSLSIAQQLLGGRPIDLLQKKETAARVREAINRLSEKDREIILLRHIEQLTNAEAAELLSITLGTARKRHGRAFRRLVQQLEEWDIISE
jgi:RNA polymerase sigma-70 factor (ECF subfamily)